MKLFFVFVIVAFLGNTHGNEDVEAVDIGVPLNPECEQGCTTEYAPRCCLPNNGCGDSMTFGNECELSVYNCNNPLNTYYEYALTECENIGEPATDVSDCPA